MPQEDREARLEREVAELKLLVERLKGDSSWPAAACSKDVPPAPPTGSYGLRGHDFQGLRGPGGEGGKEPGHDGVCPPDPRLKRESRPSRCQWRDLWLLEGVRRPDSCSLALE